MSRGTASASRRAPSGLWQLGDDPDAPETGGGDDRAGAGLPEPSNLLAPSEIPETLVVPGFPIDGDGFIRLQLQLLRTDDGHLLLVGFSSRDLLVAAMGEHQPWVQLAGTSARDLAGATAVAGLVIDPPPTLMSSAVWTEGALAALKEINDVRL
jgi:hypothetical protein